MNGTFKREWAFQYAGQRCGFSAMSELYSRLMLEGVGMKREDKEDPYGTENPAQTFEYKGKTYSLVGLCAVRRILQDDVLYRRITELRRRLKPRAGINDRKTRLIVDGEMVEETFRRRAVK